MPVRSLVPVTESSNTTAPLKLREATQIGSKKKLEQRHSHTTPAFPGTPAKGETDVQGFTFNHQGGTDNSGERAPYGDFPVSLSVVPETGRTDRYPCALSTTPAHALSLTSQPVGQQVVSRGGGSYSQETALAQNRAPSSPLFFTPPNSSEVGVVACRSPLTNSSTTGQHSPGHRPVWSVQLDRSDCTFQLTTPQTHPLSSFASSVTTASSSGRARVLPIHSSRTSKTPARGTFPLPTPVSSPPQTSSLWRSALRPSSFPIHRPEALSRRASTSVRDQQVTSRESSVVGRQLSRSLRQRGHKESPLDSSSQSLANSFPRREARSTGMGLSHSGCLKEGSPKEGSAQQSPREAHRQPSGSAYKNTISSVGKDFSRKTSESGAGAMAYGPQVDDEHWVFQRPPNNQRTFYFEEDNLEFSSQFDSGNLIQVERLSMFHYRMYTAMDCGNAPSQTNNRQWFHFSVRGGGKGVVVTITFVGMAHSNMFTYDWMPVMAVVPTRPQYTRIPGKAVVEVLETMPETPGYPLLVYRSVSKDDADSDGGGFDGDINADGADAVSSSGSPGGMALAMSPVAKLSGPGRKRKGKRKSVAMNLTFSFKIETETQITYTPPQGRPDSSAIYIASNHPYSYATLQRNLGVWEAVAKKSNATHASFHGADRELLPPSSVQRDAPEPQVEDIPAEPSWSSGRNRRFVEGARNDNDTAAAGGIYFHREVLCKSLEGRDITLLTISDYSQMIEEQAPLISEEDGLPYSSALGHTDRPYCFSNKQYVVLTARVHPGECPGSHLMHGCIDFLMNPTDSCAVALRNNFVFCIVPMLNPDGVARGHSRVDAGGVDLNRMYRNPSFKRHPAPYAVLSLLRSLSSRVLLFIDMHAHANKRGTFFYGNGMDGPRQVENLLYAKLVSLNTPYLDFRSCNFSEANMFAVGKSGKRKDSSSRVVAFTDFGILHSYTMETSHVMADALNPIVPLASHSAEFVGNSLATPPPLMHTPLTFRDTGRAMLLALLDLKGLNPKSRLPFTQFHSIRGLSMWLQRQLQIESAEMLFEQSFKTHGKEVQLSASDSGNAQLVAIMRSITAEEYPEKITLKNPRLLPRTTFSGVRSFLPLETATVLLLQTAPTGPPRSLLYSGGTGIANSAAAACYTSGKGGFTTLRRSDTLSSGGNIGSTAIPPVVIAARCRSRPTMLSDDTIVET